MVKPLVKFKISKIVQETPEVKMLRFEPIEPFDVSFKPGQFVNLYINKDGEPINARPYSISSSPLDKKGIELTIRIAGNFTQQVDKLKEGDVVKLNGPFGRFVLDEAMMKEIVMIAGGTGIAPFVSMIRYVNEKKLDTKITVFYSSRTPEHIMYFDELNKIQKENKNIKVVFTCTREVNHEWNGEKGRINEEMVKRHVDKANDGYSFICGPNEMVEMGVQIFRNIGIPDDKIILERWG